MLLGRRNKVIHSSQGISLMISTLTRRVTTVQSSAVHPHLGFFFPKLFMASFCSFVVGLLWFSLLLSSSLFCKNYTILKLSGVCFIMRETNPEILEVGG